MKITRRVDLPQGKRAQSERIGRSHFGGEGVCDRFAAGGQRGLHGCCHLLLRDTFGQTIDRETVSSV